ncbi:hypothetical protein [Rhodoblastus sp.]|uniref:hypothetical protein n=1 Tax=Rhodoblastus sp. TaxID=1962975 RepID=UPI003F9CD58A
MEQLSLFPYCGIPAHLREPRKTGWTRDIHNHRLVYSRAWSGAHVIRSERTWEVYLRNTPGGRPLEGPSGRRLFFRTAAAAIAAAERAIAEGR